MITRFFAAAVLAFTPAAFAQTYIVPDGECGDVTLHVTSGTSFPSFGDRIDPERVTQAYVHLLQRRIAVKPVASGQSLDFHADMPETGLVIASVEFAPTTTGNETQTEHAKAFIRCGGADTKWQVDTRLGLEIVPQVSDPTSQKPGQVMRFIAVDENGHKLVKDTAMELFRAGEGHVATAMPNENGIAEFPLKENGRYMVTMTYRRPDPKNEGHFLSDTSTLTFDVK
jgi:hypothetical protein